MFRLQNLFQIASQEGKSFFSTSEKTTTTKQNSITRKMLFAISATVTCGLGHYLATKNNFQQFFSSNQQTKLSVCVTGAAGQIGYSIVPLLLSGQVFGPDVDIDLRLLDIPQVDSVLKALQMQIKDGAYTNLEKVTYGSDPNVLFKDTDVVIFLGGMPRKPGMERQDLLKVNGDIFIGQGRALDSQAKKSVKSIVVANPANTNCLILADNAPSINKKNFSCLSRLDHNRTLSQLSEKTGISIENIQNVVVWGNHSTTQYPDVNHGTILGRQIRDYIQDDDFLNKEFISKIQKRGGQILAARQNSAVSSAAVATCHHLRDWFKGTNSGEFVSMGIYSDGTAYDIPAGIFYSMPVTCKNFDFQVVQNLPIDSFSREKMNISRDELLSEKADFYSIEKPK